MTTRPEHPTEPSGARPTVEAICAWLTGRLALALNVERAQIDLDRSAEDYGLDSTVVAQVCAELGEWTQGRELPPSALWSARSLRALCRALGRPGDAEPGERTAPSMAEVTTAAAVSPSGVPSAVLRASCVLRSKHRACLGRLGAVPDIVSVSYRHVDEATFEPTGSTYFTGRQLAQIRTWVSSTGGDGRGPFELWAWNDSDLALALSVVACVASEGASK